jgi:hypothetical protein
MRRDPCARIDRRHFLAALGAAGALVGSRAFGDEVKTAAREARGPTPAGRSRSSGGPLRFVAVYAPHGRARELWQPHEGFDLRYPDAILRPLDDPESGTKSFRDRLVVLGGVDLSTGIAVGTSGHDGPRVVLTGSGADGKNASLEQYLAVERGLGADTLHTSLVLGIGSDQTGIGDSISYGAGGTPLPKWIDPAQSFAELFGGPLAGDRGEAMARQRLLGKSVLDIVRADLARLASRTPATERTKMEQHREALRDIEKRLAGAERQCVAPVPAERTRFAHFGSHDGGAPSLDAVTDLQIDMLARALACDLTRFATLMLGDLSRTRMFPELPEDVHGDVAHRYDASTDKHPGTPASWKALAIQNRYSCSKIARLLTRLDEAGVLDDTIVLVSSDMGDPARHSSRDVPTLIAGGCGGHFSMGRYLDLTGASGHEGVPNNRLLVSIAQAFGVEIERFGQSADSRIVTGRLDALHV